MKAPTATTTCFVGNTAYWDETNRDGFTVTVNADGANQTLNEDASQRK